MMTSGPEQQLGLPIFGDRQVFYSVPGAPVEGQTYVPDETLAVQVDAIDDLPSEALRSALWSQVRLEETKAKIAAFTFYDPNTGRVARTHVPIKPVGFCGTVQELAVDHSESDGPSEAAHDAGEIVSSPGFLRRLRIRRAASR